MIRRAARAQKNHRMQIFHIRPQKLVSLGMQISVGANGNNGAAVGFAQSRICV